MLGGGEGVDVPVVPVCGFPTLLALPPWPGAGAVVALPPWPGAGAVVAVPVDAGFGLTVTVGTADGETGAGLAGLRVTWSPAPVAETSPGCGQTWSETRPTREMNAISAAARSPPLVPAPLT